MTPSTTTSHRPPITRVAVLLVSLLIATAALATPAAASHTCGPASFTDQNVFAGDLAPGDTAIVQGVNIYESSYRVWGGDVTVKTAYVKVSIPYTDIDTVRIYRGGSMIGSASASSALNSGGGQGIDIADFVMGAGANERLDVEFTLASTASSGQTLTTQTRVAWSDAGSSCGSSVTGFATDGSPEDIVVSNTPPTAAASASSPVDEGASVTLDASASSDPDGSIVSYEWDLDGDGQFDDATGVTASTSFADDGFYPVAVRVTDDDGAVATAPVDAVSYDAADWSSSGTASHGVSNAAGGVELAWNNDGSLSAGSWTYATTATATGTHEFDWTFRGHHSWYQADAKAYMFADGPGGTTQVLLSDQGSGGFSDSGTASIQVTQGYDFGIKVTGDHYDSSRLMHGTFPLAPSPTVVVSNVDPVLSADVDDAADEGTTVSASGSFSDAGVQDTHTVSIDWGDGSPVESAAVTQGAGSGSFAADHAYADEGVYTVTITVTDDDGGADTYTEDVTVSNAPPAVSATGDSIDEGNLASVSATFTDPGAQDTHTASIDWGDGSPVESVTPSGGSVSASHAYAEDGTYAVTVTVTDDDGGAGADTATVQVANVAPAVSASASPTAIDEGDSTTISATFTDPGAQDTHTASIDWGDGSTDTVPVTQGAGSGSLSATHTYADDAAYTVTVTVTDDEGDSGSATATVDVANVAPTADSTDVDDAADEGTTVSASGSFSDAGVQDTHTVSIDWGDGTTESASVTQGAGSGSFAADHAYADDGTYTVTMTVADGDGGSATATETVEVSNVAPDVTADADDSGVEDTPISLSASFTDPGTADTHTATIDWGDGTTETVAVSQGAGSGSLAVDHTYTTGGIYTITVTVTDDDGGSGSATDTVTVAHEEEIVVKPDDDDEARTPINLKSGGVTPVALLGSAEFDVREVDVSTVRFGDPDDVDAGAGASPAHGGHLEDVNDDGHLDLVLHFETRDLGFEDGDSVGKMVGLTDAGVPFSGTDDVDAFLPGRGNDDDADADAADDDGDDDDKKGKGRGR